MQHVRFVLRALQDNICVLVSAVEGSGGGQTLAALLVLVRRLFYRRTARAEFKRLLSSATTQGRVRQLSWKTLINLQHLLRHRSSLTLSKGKIKIHIYMYYTITTI